MFAVESHTLEAIERQVDSKDVQQKSEANQLIRRIHHTLKQNTEALEKRLDALGGSQSAIKVAAASIAGVAAGVYDQVRSETVSRMLRDDYTALNLVAVSYTMLHTTALALRDSATADLALQNLKRITPLITSINKVIPQVVVQDVHEDVKSADVSVAHQAISNTQEAWDTQHVNQTQAMAV